MPTNESHHAWYRGRLVFGILSLVTAVGYTFYAAQLPMGHLGRPGAGFWPIIVGVGTIATCLGLIGESLASPSFDEEVEKPDREEFRRSMAFGGVITVYCIALPLVGFLLSSIVVVLISMHFLAHTSWKIATLVSVGFVLPVYAFFIQVLNTRFWTLL